MITDTDRLLRVLLIIVMIALTMSISMLGRTGRYLPVSKRRVFDTQTGKIERRPVPIDTLLTEMEEENDQFLDSVQSLNIGVPAKAK